MAFSDRKSQGRAARAGQHSNRSTAGSTHLALLSVLVWTSRWEMRYFLLAACSVGVLEAGSCPALHHGAALATLGSGEFLAVGAGSASAPGVREAVTLWGCWGIII